MIQIKNNNNNTGRIDKTLAIVFILLISMLTMMKMFGRYEHDERSSSIRMFWRESVTVESVNKTNSTAQPAYNTWSLLSQRCEFPVLPARVVYATVKTSPWPLTSLHCFQRPHRPKAISDNESANSFNLFVITECCYCIGNGGIAEWDLEGRARIL